MFRRTIPALGRLKIIANTSTRYFQRNFFCSVPDTKPVLSFGAFLHRRRQEAQRTIVFQVNEKEAYGDVQQYWSQFGSANQAFHYQGKRGENFILVEFEHKETADEIVRSQLWGGEHTERTRFPKFNSKALSKTLPKLDSSAKIVELNTTEGKAALSKTDTHELLLQAESVDEQIEILFRQTAINDLFTRLRFLAMAQIEDAIKGVCPNARTYPFGSSVSGLGRVSSDLDMVLTNHTFTVPSMASIMEFMPGIYRMTPLPDAMVPIIKYHHSFCVLEADLAFDLLRGVLGTELLYFCGELDKRVRPLIFALRWWTQIMDVTRPNTGRWITNYGLCLLVIFYLQQLEKPILPSLQRIYQLERAKIDEHGLLFIDDIRQLNFKTENIQSIAELITGFFTYYDNFNYNKYAICPERGTVEQKEDFAPLDIINLFNCDNVAGNMNRTFYNKLRKALNISNSLNFDLKNECKKSKVNWGLAKLFYDSENIMFERGKPYRNFRRS